MYYIKINTLIVLLAMTSIIFISGVSSVYSDPYNNAYSGQATVLTNRCSVGGKVIFRQNSGESYESFRNRCDAAMTNSNSSSKSDRSYERTEESIKLFRRLIDRPSKPSNQSRQPDDIYQNRSTSPGNSSDDNPFENIQSTSCDDLQKYKNTQLAEDLNYALKLEASLPDAIALLKEVEEDVSFYKSTVELADGMKIFLQSTKLTTNLILNTMKAFPGEGEAAGMIKDGSDILTNPNILGKVTEALENNQLIDKVRAIRNILFEEVVKVYIKNRFSGGVYDKMNLFYTLAKDVSAIKETGSNAEGVKNKAELIERSKSLRSMLESQNSKYNAAKDTARSLKLVRAEIDRKCPPMTLAPKSDTDVFRLP